MRNASGSAKVQLACFSPRKKSIFRRWACPRSLLSSFASPGQRGCYNDACRFAGPPMTTRKVAVIGGGVAGVSAALAASRLGAKTTLIDSSKRVGLSKALMPFLISDGWTEDDLVLPEAKALAGEGVDTHTGERVTSVQRAGDKMRVESSSRRGTSAGFDSVVICTGAASEAPQLRGLSKPNVFVLGGARRLPEVLRRAGRLSDGRRLGSHPPRAEARRDTGEQGEARTGLLREGRPRAPVLRPRRGRHPTQGLLGRERGARPPHRRPGRLDPRGREG